MNKHQRNFAIGMAIGVCGVAFVLLAETRIEALVALVLGVLFAAPWLSGLRVEVANPFEESSLARTWMFVVALAEAITAGVFIAQGRDLGLILDSPWKLAFAVLLPLSLPLALWFIYAYQSLGHRP
jgi:membrane protein CcdC involved in cytochrome C biogenesis